MIDLTPEELMGLACSLCDEFINEHCEECCGSGVSRSALAELIRARCEAAWKSGELSGFARGTRFARQNGMGDGLIPDPDPNPFAKGGA